MPLGRPDLAIAEMQNLRVIEPAEQDTLHLADLFVRRGDLPQAASTIVSLRTLDGIHAGDALRFARVLSRDDPEQAKRLWHHAVKQDLDAPLLPAALTTARQLSLGPEAAPVVQRMAAVAQPFGDGQEGVPVLTLSMDQVLDFFKARHHALRASVTGMFSLAIERVVADGADLSTVQQLLSIAVDLSKDDSGVFQPQVFEQACQTLSRAGAYAEAAIRRFVFQAVTRLPFALAERVWPLLISLRAL